MRKYCLILIALVAALTLAGNTQHVTAADDPGAFSIQISPSPLVATVKPGVTTDLELKIVNTGTAPENLRIAARTFKLEKEQLQLNDTQEPEIAKWITFGAPTFTLGPAQSITQKISMAVPKEAGFSYSFALVVNRTVDASKTGGARTLKGVVAVFGLINVDRPGAVRKLEIASFKPAQDTYEYLPAEFLVEFKNTGNTIVQPAGNVFVQRGSHDENPIDVLDVNETAGYILPGTNRTMRVTWSNGFPLNARSTGADGTIKTETNWDWNNLGNFRFGQYTAKLVAIYNDGHRDVPLEAEAKVWVMPWKILLGIVAIVVVIGFGVWSMVSKVIKVSKKVKPKKLGHR